MPSFPDSIFLFVLALLLFGPKRLPVLARELGKWVGEFRRASNEFKMQMEEELRLSEQTEKNKQIAAAAPAIAAPAIAAAAIAETVPSEPAAFAEEDMLTGTTAATIADSKAEAAAPYGVLDGAPYGVLDGVLDGVQTPLPIAVSGELRIMPPATGLPVAQRAGARSAGTNSALEGLLDAIPAGIPAGIPAAIPEAIPAAEPAAEASAHGD